MCPHHLTVMTCGLCLAKKAWPKGQVPCMCGRFKLKGEWRCRRCLSVYKAIKQERDIGRVVHSVISPLN